MTKQSLQWRDGRLADVSESPVQFYEVSKDLFFKEFQGQLHNSKLCHQAMSQLMGRYCIQKKKVLSLGPGQCEQEYWLAENQNELLLVDIDEKGNIEPKLKQLESETVSKENSITYAIGDARRVGEYLTQPFDIVASFGFTPDEFHRTTIQKEMVADNWGWPIDANPFSSIILDVCDSLPDGGLLASLSYCGGPDASLLPYIPAMQTGLKNRGLLLLEVYTLSKVPGVHLVIAAKTDDISKIVMDKNVRITTIHPKNKEEPGVCKLIFSAVEKGPDSSAFDAQDKVVRDVLRAAFSGQFSDSGSACLYDGRSPSEVSALLSTGMHVNVIANKISAVAHQPFTDYGQMQFVAPDDLPNLNRVNLIWLNMVERDDTLRHGFASSLHYRGKPKRWIFSDISHRLFNNLEKGGGVVVIGRAGVEINKVPKFSSQLAAELNEHGIVLEDLYVLKIATGIFMVIGRKSSTPRRNEEINCFYPQAQDSSVIKLKVKRTQVAKAKSVLDKIFNRFFKVSDDV